MNLRRKFGALLGAGGLLLMATTTVIAAPAYSIVVQKTADPATVPAGGGTVVYTIWVENTSGVNDFFQLVEIDEGMAGCTLGAPTGDTDTDTKLDPGETWAYSCTVTGVTPGTANTATVFACNEGGGDCDAEDYDATGTGSVTVGADAPDPTEANTDTNSPVGSTRPDNTIALVIALGALLASVVLLAPKRSARKR